MAERLVGPARDFAIVLIERSRGRLADGTIVDQRPAGENEIAIGKLRGCELP